MESVPEHRIVLRKTSRHWPVVLFPHHQDSHTIVFTGRETVRDIKFGVGSATLILTDRDLFCRLNILPFLVLKIKLSDITRISRMEGKEGILEVRFTKADRGFVTKMALSGEPSIPNDRVLLNLGRDIGEWQRELVMRFHTSESAEGE